MSHGNIKSLEQENELYRRAKVCSMRLKIPFIEPFIRVTKILSDGKRLNIINRHSRSFVRNMLNEMSAISVIQSAGTSETYGDGSLVANNLNGSRIDTRLIFTQNSRVNDFVGYAFNAAANIDSNGIIIGTDGTGESIDDYSLRSLINQGVGAGQMSYALQSRSAGWNGGSGYYYLTCTRVFSNGSGGTITVSEMGIIFQTSSLAGYDWLVARDVFEAIAVDDGESLEGEYELRVQFP